MPASAVHVVRRHPQLHWENKHPKLPFNPAACEDLHASAGGVTTQGVAVRGARKK